MIMVREFLAGWYFSGLINPPDGYIHLFPAYKSKFVEKLARKNKLSGDDRVIEKEFSYSIHITGPDLDEFMKAGNEAAIKILAAHILSSLSNFDRLKNRSGLTGKNLNRILRCF